MSFVFFAELRKLDAELFIKTLCRVKNEANRITQSLHRCRYSRRMAGSAGAADSRRRDWCLDVVQWHGFRFAGAS
jgi:hypothetical protein